MFDFLKKLFAGPPPSLTKQITDERLVRWRSYPDYIDWCRENNVLPDYIRWLSWYYQTTDDGPGAA
jgi:hypothetical protein